MRRKDKVRLTNIATYCLIILILAVFLFPIYWMYVSSFMSIDVLFKIPPRFIFEPTLENYMNLFEKTFFLRGLYNQITVAAGVTILNTMLSFLAGYALARLDLPGKENIGGYFLLTWAFPFVAIALPLYLFLKDVGLLGSHLGLIFVDLFGIMPITIWLARGYLAAIPRDIDEAAMIDGCSRFKAFLNIILPLSKGGIAVVALITLILAWNELQASLLFTTSQTVTAAATLEGLAGKKIAYQWVMAGASIIVTPILVIALFAQKQLIRGLTFGAVKA